MPDQQEPEEPFVCDRCGREEWDRSYVPLCLDCYHLENADDD